MISFNLLFSTNIILEIDHLLLPPACYYASAMPASIRPTARVCNNVHKSVEHDFCTTCYERPPVLSDRFRWAEGVVAQDKFYSSIEEVYFA